MVIFLKQARRAQHGGARLRAVHVPGVRRLAKGRWSTVHYQLKWVHELHKASIVMQSLEDAYSSRCQ